MSGDKSASAAGRETRRQLVALTGVSKRFGAVRALDEVSVAITAGTVHALVGENGAGKSTMGKVIAGLVRPDSGTVRVDGREVSYRAPREALADGIATMAQELALAPARSVVENVYLARESPTFGIARPKRLARRYEELMARLDFDLPAETLVRDLRLADRQKVEIARAVAREARLIVMDEPTASLAADETTRLMATIRGLVAAGTTIVFVSHFLEEVLEIADEITVMRDGRIVRSGATTNETTDSLVRAMLGRSMEQAFPPRRPPAADPAPRLEIDNATHRGRFSSVSLSVGGGEIVGLAGLVGSGRTELARSVFGADPLDQGTVTVSGRSVPRRGPRASIRAGLQLLPEDRKTQGLVLRRSVLDNITLGDLGAVASHGIVRPSVARSRATELIERLGIRAASADIPVGALSGGNQQKVLLARCLFTEPRVLIADEPTRGVDVGAKRLIYDVLAALAGEGMAILVISSELEEVLGLSHRVAVMRRGELVAQLSGPEITEERVMAAAFGDGVSGGAR